MPDAIKLVDASAFYPQSAVVGGWVARTDYYNDNKEVLGNIIRAWADANDYIVRNPLLRPRRCRRATTGRRRCPILPKR